MFETSGLSRIALPKEGIMMDDELNHSPFCVLTHDCIEFRKTVKTAARFGLRSQCGRAIRKEDELTQQYHTYAACHGYHFYRDTCLQREP